MLDLLHDAANRSARYIAESAGRRVAPSPEAIAGLDALGGGLPEKSSDPGEILAILDQIGSPATVTTSGGRYFGFVIGGALPAALAANWLAGAWDEYAACTGMSTVAARLEEVVLGWVLELLGLPATCGGGFVTGTTMANFSGLAAGRTALLKRAGWDVEEQGLFGAPPIQIVVGEEVHVSLLKALAMLGLGRSRVIRVPADGQGRMIARELPELTDRTLVCAQAGNVNTGRCDPVGEICSRAKERGAWVP
jgi:glutamate/tyrosine decarboxylase-like PLP-dependent enzyme